MGNNISLGRSLSKQYLRSHSVPQRKHLSITNIIWLILVEEIIPNYTDNHTKFRKRQTVVVLIVKTAGTVTTRLQRETKRYRPKGVDRINLVQNGVK